MMGIAQTPRAGFKSVMLLLAAACGIMLSSGAAAGPPKVSMAPAIRPPVTKPHPFVGDLSDLAAHGYVQEEFFFENSSPGPYKSRMLVFRPRDPKKFNGIVVVEWLNVSAMHDINLGWGLLQDEILRGGYAYVAVDAQVAGLEHLTRWDPARYGTLKHPDPLPPPMTRPAPGAPPPTDAAIAAMMQSQWGSYMIFAEAAQALRGGTGPRPLGPLRPRHLIAYGNSQSAARLSGFVNEKPDLAAAYDAYLIHAGPLLITNTRAKVFGLNSENEAPRYYALRDRQPGPDSYAYWEVAGTAHSPSRSLTETLMLSVVRDKPFGAGTDAHNAFEARASGAAAIAPRQALAAELAGNAILRHLSAWITTGKRPPAAPFMEMSSTAPHSILRDAYGNAKGGVRLPHVEVPVGRYWTNGLFPALDPFNGEKASSPGSPVGDEWDEPTLSRLYPTHEDYVRKVGSAVAAAVAAGHLLKVDGDALNRQAAAARVP